MINMLSDQKKINHPHNWQYLCSVNWRFATFLAPNYMHKNHFFFAWNRLFWSRHKIKYFILYLKLAFRAHSIFKRFRVIVFNSQMFSGDCFKNIHQKAVDLLNISQYMYDVWLPFFNHHSASEVVYRLVLKFAY